MGHSGQLVWKVMISLDNWSQVAWLSKMAFKYDDQLVEKTEDSWVKTINRHDGLWWILWINFAIKIRKRLDLQAGLIEEYYVGAQIYSLGNAFRIGHSSSN